MSRDELYEKWKQLIDLDNNPNLVGSLSEALYSADYINLIAAPINENQAIVCWKIINALLEKEFPSDMII